MGRFYKGATPTFAEDGIYQPPWELAQQTLNINEQGVDNALAKAELFKNIDIKYINDPEEAARVQKVKDYYTNKANEITSALQKDPMSWRSLAPDLNQFSKQLEEDYTSGNISKFQSSYNNYQNWEESNKDLDPITRGIARKKFFKDWINNPNRSLDRTWSGEDIIKTPELNVEQWMKKQPNSYVSSDGRYIYNNKEITKKQATDLALADMLSRPEAMGYLKQQHDIFERDSENPYLYIDEAGNRVTRNEKIPGVKYQEIVNPDYAFAPQMNLGKEALPYTQRDMEVDKYGTMYLNRAWAQGDKAENLTPFSSVEQRVVAKTAEQLTLINKPYANFVWNTYKSAKMEGYWEKKVRAEAEAKGLKPPVNIPPPTEKDVMNYLTIVANYSGSTDANKKAAKNLITQMKNAKQDLYRNSARASWMGYSNVYGAGAAEEMRKNVEAVFKVPGNVENLPCQIVLPVILPNGKTVEKVLAVKSLNDIRGKVTVDQFNKAYGVILSEQTFGDLKKSLYNQEDIGRNSVTGGVKLGYIEKSALPIPWNNRDLMDDRNQIQIQYRGADLDAAPLDVRFDFKTIKPGVDWGSKSGPASATGEAQLDYSNMYGSGND